MFFEFSWCWTNWNCYFRLFNHSWKTSQKRSASSVLRRRWLVSSRLISIFELVRRTSISWRKRRLVLSSCWEITDSAFKLILELYFAFRWGFDPIIRYTLTNSSWCHFVEQCLRTFDWLLFYEALELLEVWTTYEEKNAYSLKYWRKCHAAETVWRGHEVHLIAKERTLIS